MPNQYGDDEVALILAAETRQRQDQAAKRALGEPTAPPPEPGDQRASRPEDADRE